MRVHTEVAGRAGWHKEVAGPGHAVTACCDRIGEDAFVVGIQAGVADKHDPLVWYVCDSSPGFLWTVFESHEDFVRWISTAPVPKVENRHNFFEAVPSVTRLVFEASKRHSDDDMQGDTKDKLFLFICKTLLPWLHQMFCAAGFDNAGVGNVDTWRFTDASDNGRHAFRAYSQTVKWTETARHAVIDAIRKKLASRSWWSSHYDIDFQSFAYTGQPVALPRCVDARTADSITNDPVRPDSVQRMLAGERLTYLDFLSSGGFTDIGGDAPIDMEHVSRFSLDPRFVHGDALDVTTPAAPPPRWLVDAAAEYNALGFGPVDAVKDMVGLEIVYPEGHAMVRLKASAAVICACPAGIKHDPPATLLFLKEVVGSVSVTCCGPVRGAVGELHVLDKNNNRKRGVTVSRSATAAACCRLTLTPAKTTDLFLQADVLKTLPQGQLPPLTRAKRQELRDQFGKPNANLFILTHVCASGKTWNSMIPAVVEHVRVAEQRPGFKTTDLFVVLSAPTRNLVRSLCDDVNKALKDAGLVTPCRHYQDEEITGDARGVIAVCTHSLHRFSERGGKMQLLVVDEAAEGVESVTQLNSNILGQTLRAMKHADEAIWADAMAGQSISDALQYLRMHERQTIVLDTPSIRPYRNGPTEIQVPVSSTGVLAGNAAIALALEKCRGGYNVLFCSPTVFEVRLLEKLARQAGIEVTVAHSKMPDTEAFIDSLKNSRRDVAACSDPADVVSQFQLFAFSPIVQSGISSRRLIDIVVADVKGCTVSAKILMQMVQRARDPGTQVILVVTDPQVVRLPGGRWTHERVDVLSASAEVQQHCAARALADASSIAGARDILRMADLQKAFGDGVGLVTVGIHNAPRTTVPVDDEAFYARVPQNQAGKGNNGTMWVRFARQPQSPGRTAEEALKRVSRKERLSQAVIQHGHVSRIGALLPVVDRVAYEKDDMLKRIEAGVIVDKVNLARDFLPTLEAILRREERRYDRPKLRVLSDEELGDMHAIEAVRKEMRSSDVVAYARFEKHQLRPVGPGQKFATAEQRYASHWQMCVEHEKYARIYEQLQLPAKRSRGPTEAEPVSVTEHAIDEPDDDDEEEEDDDDHGDRHAKGGLGDAPKLAWESYLTYGAVITGEVVDQLLDAKDEEEVKKLTRRITSMNTKEVKEAFRVLHQIHQNPLDKVHGDLVERWRRRLSTRTDEQLELWLVVNDVLIAAGWARGVFDTGKVSEFMQSRDPTWTAAPHAAERARSEATIRALDGVKHIKPYNISMRGVNEAIRLYLFPKSNGRAPHDLDFCLREGQDEAGGVFWIVQRSGNLWDYLARCPDPEWHAFFAGHWAKGQGVYTEVNGVKPPPRV